MLPWYVLQVHPSGVKIKRSKAEPVCPPMVRVCKERVYIYYTWYVSRLHEAVEVTSEGGARCIRARAPRTQYLSNSRRAAPYRTPGTGAAAAAAEQYRVYTGGVTNVNPANLVVKSEPKTTETLTRSRLVEGGVYQVSYIRTESWDTTIVRGCAVKTVNFKAVRKTVATAACSSSSSKATTAAITDRFHTIPHLVHHTEHGMYSTHRSTNICR